MRLSLFLLIGLFFQCCSQQGHQEILIPELHHHFYKEALNQINLKQKSGTSDINLIDQKLYYCDQLDWPVSCISALDSYRAHFGMNNQLIEQYIAYYQTHNQHQLLVEVIEKWNQKYDLQKSFRKPFIHSLVQLKEHERAKLELQHFVLFNQAKEDTEFASKNFLQLRDTFMAIFHLNRLAKVDPSNDLMMDYGSILIHIDHKNEGFKILADFLSSKSLRMDQRIRIAKSFEAANHLSKARNMIKPFSDIDTLAYLIVEWYTKDFFWDSAVMYVDKILSNDSGNAEAWWKKGQIYEDRGWLSHSLRSFKEALKINPNDSAVIQQIQVVQRKIAYLQRRKFEENKIPPLELKSIKINRE